MQRSIYHKVVFLAALGLLFGCGRQDAKPTADSNFSNNGKNPSVPTGSPSEAEQKAEKQRTISFSKSRLTIKGIPIQIGKTKSGDLEKIIGPPDRTIDLPVAPYLIALWDKQGFRAYYFPKKSGKVQYFDCVFVVETTLETEPMNSFSGDFVLEGLEISKDTTKQSLQGKMGEKLTDHSFNLPGFSAKYPHHDISFERTKDRKGLQHVRISPAIPGRK